MEGIKGLKFSVLQTGWIEKDKSMDFAMYNMGNNANRTPPAQWWRVPNLAFLISHPQSGYILIDGGARRGCQYQGGARQPEIEKYTPFYVEENQWIENQLALLGLTVDDLSMVVITNYFWNKVGVLELLEGKKAAEQVYVPQADFGYGIVETHIEKKDFGFNYMYRDFEIPGITYTYVDGDMRLAEGVELLVLPGNTPATLGVLLRAESGNYILPGAAVPTAENYGPPEIRPCKSYDSVSYFKTVKELRRLVDVYDAKLLYAHDPLQINEIKTAPYFY